MAVLNVAMYGSDELAKQIAKATDQRDVHTYVHKESTDGVAKIISIIRPARYPERLRPLLNAISAGRVGIIEINAIDATLGEVLVAFASSSIALGIAIVNPKEGEWIDQDMAEKMFAQAGLTKWQFMTSDGLEIRNKLYDLMDEIQDDLTDSASSPLVVSIDQHFNVKGVGLVAIGYVQSGSLSKHDEVEVLPASDVGVVRSLQVMDDDVEVAFSGDRVGVALRNLREQSLHRGCMICVPGDGALVGHESSSFDLELAPFQRKELSVGDVVHAASDLQFTVGRVSGLEGSSVVVEWDSPLWIRGDGSSRVLIVQLDAVPMRVMGRASNIQKTG